MNTCDVCEAPKTWGSCGHFEGVDPRIREASRARLCDRHLTAWVQWITRYKFGSAPRDPVFVPYPGGHNTRLDHGAWRRDYDRFLAATRQEERGVPA